MEVRFMKSSLSDVLASTATVMFEMDPSRICLIPRDERVQRVADASKDGDFFSGLFLGIDAVRDDLVVPGCVSHSSFGKLNSTSKRKTEANSWPGTWNLKPGTPYCSSTPHLGQKTGLAPFPR